MPDRLLVAIPSADGRMLIGAVPTILLAAAHLQRPLHIIAPRATGISRCRNEALQMASEATGEDHAWILWMDSDMTVPPEFARALADDIAWAEANDRNWTTNTPMADGRNVLMDADGRHLEDHEVDAIPQWGDVAWGGLAFAYARMPLAYRFHEDSRGEDWHLHRELDLRFAFARNLKVLHNKERALVGPATWEEKRVADG